MISVALFIVAILVGVCHLTYRKEWHEPKITESFLGYILFFNMGIMGFLAAYAHVFMGPETAQLIGWEPGSPFQFEMGMANLAFGVLGVLSYFYRGSFWNASIIGWSVLLIGCFIGHTISYYADNNTAPYNMGPFIWFYDMLLPALVLGLLYRLRRPVIL